MQAPFSCQCDDAVQAITARHCHCQVCRWIMLCVLLISWCLVAAADKLLPFCCCSASHYPLSKCCCSARSCLLLICCWTASSHPLSGCCCSASTYLLSTCCFTLSITPQASVKAQIVEPNCIGCAQCIKKCPFDAIKIVNVAGQLAAAAAVQALTCCLTAAAVLATTC